MLTHFINVALSLDSHPATIDFWVRYTLENEASIHLLRPSGRPWNHASRLRLYESWRPSSSRVKCLIARYVELHWRLVHVIHVTQFVVVWVACAQHKRMKTRVSSWRLWAASAQSKCLVWWRIHGVPYSSPNSLKCRSLVYTSCLELQCLPTDGMRLSLWFFQSCY